MSIKNDSTFSVKEIVEKIHKLTKKDLDNILAKSRFCIDLDGEYCYEMFEYISLVLNGWIPEQYRIPDAKLYIIVNPDAKKWTYKEKEIQTDFGIFEIIESKKIKRSNALIINQEYLFPYYLIKVINMHKMSWEGPQI